MFKKPFLKLSLISAIGIIIIIFIFSISFAYKFYVNTFRLSQNQISTFLSGTISPCRKIADCTLLPGDILIRRYITERTWIFDKFIHPYFTHSAFYLGNDQIVEAVGTEKNPEDEIQIATLSKSDWLDIRVNNFVIIRPKYSTAQLDTINENLKKIAEDPDYKFGLPKMGYKRATCVGYNINK
ncbi:MAG: hypothetical protein NTU76_02060 [Candidatus Taylorbacteria bacterium]|nr:hypothetical protein [Candidatus Taylorbacteria bacterium]